MQSFPFPVASQEQTIVKGVSQLYMRLFGHHAALQADFGQMKQFDVTTEANEKMGQVVEDKLKRCQQVVETCDKELASLSDINRTLLAAKQMCDTIIRDSGTHNKQEYLTKERDSRAEKWEEFMSEVDRRQSEVDSKYNSDRMAVKKRYDEAEMKLLAGHNPDLVH